jgi:hypothetical protein
MTHKKENKMNGTSPTFRAKVRFEYASAKAKGYIIHGVRCLFPGCGWEKQERAWEIVELRLHQHMKQEHQINLSGDSYVVR